MPKIKRNSFNQIIYKKKIKLCKKTLEKQGSSENFRKDLIKIGTRLVKKTVFWKSDSKNNLWSLRIYTFCVCMNAEILTVALAESSANYSQPAVCVIWLVLFNVSVWMCMCVCLRVSVCGEGVELPYEDLQRLVQASYFLIYSPPSLLPNQQHLSFSCRATAAVE